MSPTPRLILVRLSAVVTVTVRPVPGGDDTLVVGPDGDWPTRLLAHVNPDTRPVPASSMPKVVDAPAASFPLYDSLTAVAVVPEVLTMALQVLTIRCPVASV